VRVPGPRQQQAAIARTDFQHPQRPVFGESCCQCSQRAEQLWRACHGAMHPLQVIREAHGIRVVCAKTVQQLRRDDTLHHSSTFSKAPWQLKPAPNDDNHHQAAWHVIGQRGLQYKIHKSTRQVAVFTQHPRWKRKSSAPSESRCSKAFNTSRPPACMIHAWMSLVAKPWWSRSVLNTCCCVLSSQRRYFARPKCDAACRPASRTSTLAVARFDQRGAVNHSMCLTLGCNCLDKTAAPAPSPNRQALINTPGSLSRYMAALADFTQSTAHGCRTKGQQGVAQPQMGSAAAQPWPPDPGPDISAQP